jgi:hypothetical protein
MTNRSYRIRAGNRVLDVTMMTWPRDDRPVPERSGELNASRTPSAARNRHSDGAAPHESIRRRYFGVAEVFTFPGIDPIPHRSFVERLRQQLRRPASSHDR